MTVTAQSESARIERTPVVPPDRTVLQRMDALERANEIRTRRAQLKKDLKAGRVSIDVLLPDPPDYLQTAKVFDMLLAVPKYGRVKANKALKQCAISPSKTLGGLSRRQRFELARMLRNRDARPMLFDDPLTAPLVGRTQPPAVAAGVRNRTAASGAERG